MKVIICISTYNGQLFFDEQIVSILNQTYKDFEVLIRDDGSTNAAFIEQLRDYEKKFSRIKVFYEQNIGVTLSFYELLRKCPSDADFILLADQDDVWYPTRIENTLNFVQKERPETPLLSFCRFEYVNEDLKYISTAPVYSHVGFTNALIQNLAAGCTICLNSSAHNLLLTYTPKKSVIHDWWIYLVISAVGKVIQEPYISIKYRQHRFNTLGGTTSVLEKNRRRFKHKLNRLIYKVYDQAEELYSNFYELISNERRNQIERFLQTKRSFTSKCLFLFDINTVKREKKFDSILLKLVILFS